VRIFQVLSAQATGGLAQSKIWLRNLYEPLVDLGHDVYLFHAEEGAQAKALKSDKLRARFSQKLLDTFQNEHTRRPFDLFFAYLMDGMVESGAIDEIHKSGVPTCNFSCNNTHQFDLVDELSPHFDYNLHSEKDTAQKFRNIGANPIWFPMAANPKYYHPINVSRTLDVSFVGRNYAKRPYYIWHLLENGIDAHIYGPEWRLKSDTLLKQFLRVGKRTQIALKALLALSFERKARQSSQLARLDFSERLRTKYSRNLHYPLTDEEMISKYSGGKISLGFLEVFDGHDASAIVKQHLHLRDFEAPMCGALYLTGYCGELEHFYEPDKEVVVYRNEHEMLDKVKYYLMNPSDAMKIRKAGLQKSLNNNTYKKRFISLFETIGFSNR
jgi:spore maturation protein CgeB